jgi:hypothetical protein
MPMTGLGGGFNWSSQHSNLLSRMENSDVAFITRQPNGLRSGIAGRLGNR